MFRAITYIQDFKGFATQEEAITYAQTQIANPGNGGLNLSYMIVKDVGTVGRKPVPVEIDFNPIED